MPIQVASNIIPKSGALWPVVEDKFVKGGMRVVPDYATRDALHLSPTASLGLKTGMLVVTANDMKLWQYVATGTWVEFRQPITHVHIQSVESDTWNIAHGKSSRHFTYTLFYDDDGEVTQCFPNNVVIVDDNNLLMTFLKPITGHVTLNF